MHIDVGIVGGFADPLLWALGHALTAIAPSVAEEGALIYLCVAFLLHRLRGPSTVSWAVCCPVRSIRRDRGRAGFLWASCGAALGWSAVQLSDCFVGH